MDYREYRSKYGNAQNGTPQQHVEDNEKACMAQKLKLAIAALILILAIVLIALLIVTLSKGSRPDFVARSVTVEAGRSSLSASDFLVDKSHTSEFGVGTEFDLSSVGEYKIALIVDGKQCESTLIVIDTKAPVATVTDISIWEDSELAAEDCVKDINDATSVKVSFKNKPNTKNVGSQTVTVILEDEGKNKTEYTFTLTVVSTEGLLYNHYVCELGEPIPPAEVFTGKTGVGEYLSEMSGINTDLVGVYVLQISANGTVYDVVLEIADRTPPIATVTHLECYNILPEASSFVSDIVDKSEVTVRFETEPTPGVSGRVDVNIVLTDAYGNSTVYATYFTVLNDTTPPVFVKAPDSLEVDTGKTIIWRAAVEATDDNGTPELSLDTTGADLNVPGVYTVYIVATDRAGNQAKKAVKLNVNDGSITDDMLADAIDKLDKELGITSNMTVEEKIYAVFRFAYDNIKYSNTSKHVDWRKEAYECLSGALRGDCFTYCASSYAILRHIGFDAYIVERADSAKVEGTGTHFWVMVNIGTAENPKWYHFDATPQRAPFILATYLMTNAQIDALTRWRNEEYKLENYYTYDVDLFPKASEQPLVNLEIPAKYFSN